MLKIESKSNPGRHYTLCLCGAVRKKGTTMCRECWAARLRAKKIWAGTQPKRRELPLLRESKANPGRHYTSCQCGGMRKKGTTMCSECRKISRKGPIIFNGLPFDGRAKCKCLCGAPRDRKATMCWRCYVTSGAASLGAKKSWETQRRKRAESVV